MFTYKGIKIGRVYSLEFTDVPEVFFTQNILALMWSHVIADKRVPTLTSISHYRVKVTLVMQVLQRNATGRRDRAQKVFLAHAKAWRTSNHRVEINSWNVFVCEPSFTDPPTPILTILLNPWRWKWYVTAKRGKGYPEIYRPFLSSSKKMSGQYADVR